MATSAQTAAALISMPSCHRYFACIRFYSVSTPSGNSFHSHHTNCFAFSASSQPIKRQPLVTLSTLSRLMLQCTKSCSWMCFRVVVIQETRLRSASNTGKGLHQYWLKCQCYTAAPASRCIDMGCFSFTCSPFTCTCPARMRLVQFKYSRQL